MKAVDRLVQVVAKLRAPGGCPWDRKQTHRTLIKYLREETRELAAALSKGDPKHMEEELGDVLLQVVLHSQLASETGLFEFQDVARTLTRKLIHRHPHVFGGKKLRTAAQVVRQWEALKRKEKRRRKGPRPLRF